MNDDKVLEQILSSSEYVEVPEKLSPKNMEEKIKQCIEVEQKYGGSNRKKRNDAVRKMGTMAAVIVIFLVAVTCISRIGVNSSKEGAIKINTVVREAKDYKEVYHKIEEMYQEKEKYMQESCWKMEDGVVSTEESVTDIESSATSEIAMDTAESSDNSTSGANVSDAAAPENGEEFKQEDSASSGETDFSETNIQVQGVEEGDIVKTDGQYIYTLTESNVYIVKADQGQLARVSEINLQDTDYVTSNVEMYLAGDKLILIQNEWSGMIEPDSPEINAFVQSNENKVSVKIYDITDRANPQKIGMTTQQGFYYNSRLVDGYLYLFTNQENYGYHAYNYKENEMIYGVEKVEEYVPTCNDELIPPEDILVPEYVENQSYFTISSISLDEPDKISDIKTILSNPRQIYVSTENIYLELVNSYEREDTRSNIVRLTYKEGVIEAEAAGAINGYTNDSFSYDEYNGNLRIVTTVRNYRGDTFNNLYVLDEEMNVVGKIGNLAKDETIESARFMGDTGYFVTFKQMDPLFSVDLSDPTNPTILGELKITGFSEYLHFYGENKLLGIGWEIDPETQENKGIKLSMFDISDPSNVQEVDKVVLNDIDGTSAVFNYKSVLINEKKNIIGFNGCNWDEDGMEKGKYLIYAYNEETGFENTFNREVDIVEPQSPGWRGYDNIRGIFIGDYLYISSYKQIESFNMTNGYQQVALLP